MKKIYSIAFFIAIAFNSMSQNFAWAKEGGSYAYDYGYGVCTDAAGNVYVAGKFEGDQTDGSGNAYFGNITVYCQGNHDMFVAKYNSAGVIQWVRTGGGEVGDYAHGITCDATGN